MFITQISVMNRNFYLKQNVSLQILKYSNVIRKQTPVEYCLELVRYFIIIDNKYMCGYSIYILLFLILFHI